MTILEGWERNARLGPITIAVLREHADRLASALGVTVAYAGHDYVRGTRKVFGPSIVDRRGYARRCHEFGHTQCVAAEQHGRTYKLLFGTVANTSGESAAWTWAREHALTWSDDMQAELRRCLATYSRYADHGVNDRIWRELDRDGDGRLTLGHAKHLLSMAGQPSTQSLRERLERLTR